MHNTNAITGSIQHFAVNPFAAEFARVPLISTRIEQVQTPIIPVVADLIKANPGTISLGQGVVFYQPPNEIHQGIERFLKLKSHHYEAVEGIEELRFLIQRKIQQENGINSDNYQIVVCAGSNMGFLNAILTVCDPDDQVILLKPWYFNHEMAIRIANCVPVAVDTDSNFQPDVEVVKKSITSKTKAIVTISPNNPTGAVYRPQTLDQINGLCAERNIYHIHDEAYEYFCYDGNSHYSPASREAAAEHTISLYSTSKSFGLANWRIGYMVIPPHLFKPIRKIQDTNLICPTVISQYAAIECLKLGRQFCEPNVKMIESVRSHLANSLNPFQTIVQSPLEGAFYAFVTMSNLSVSDFEAVKFLIRKHKVAVIPGSAFGMANSPCLRVSYGALEPKTAINGIDRLRNGFEELLNSQ